MKKTVMMLTALFFCASLSVPPIQGKEKDTFSISLVQQATVKRMQDKKVVYERYKVKKGDFIYKLLRQRNLLKKPELPELMSLLKTMNKSLKNLDLIHPGQTILIPLKIVPIKGFKKEAKVDQESVMDVASPEEITFDNYVVKPGDSLAMIVKNRFEMSPEYFHDHYLKLVKKFNPTLTNPDLIYPRQVIRLPIYSPEIVRMPIKTEKKGTVAEKSKKTPGRNSQQTLALKQGMKDIFKSMGEEWLDSGEQFIPLRSGGQINLKAESFPVLNLSSGIRVIVDLNTELPEEVSRLIESDWNEYKIVHRSPDDNLGTVLEKIFAVSGYHRVLKSGEPLKITRGTGLSLAGDWTIIPQKAAEDSPPRIVIITLIKSKTEQTPPILKKYLMKTGITVIDYPDFYAVAAVKQQGPPPQKKIQLEQTSEFPLPTRLLTLVGQSFSSKVKIPVYRSKGTGFNLIIEADLFFNRKEKGYIIDTTGLSPAIASLLEKHQLRVLSLAGEKDPIRMTTLILDFLGHPFVSRLHYFSAAARDERRNIKLTIPGVSFHDRYGKRVLVTGVPIPDELLPFLNRKGYHLFDVSRLKN